MACPSQIVLQQTRTIIHELKKSEIFRNNNAEEGKALSMLKDLQLKTRCDLKAVLNLCEVMNPFLNLLRINSISGPYKLLALRSIQIFLECDLFRTRSLTNEQALIQIINSIINCKFVQTEAKFDDTVQLQMLQTLNNLVTYVDYVVCLVECSDIVHFCLIFLARSTAEMHSTAQHELALAIVHKIISGTVSFVGDGGELSFSTIVSVMEFIASQFRRFIGLSTFAIPADDVQSASNVVDAGNDVGLGLGLDLLRIFTTELQLHSSALKYFLRNVNFLFYFQQELPFCMITLGTLQLSAELLNELLVIFTTITCVCGDVMKYFVEHFIRQVYLKQFRTISDLLHQQVGETHPLVGNRVPPHDLIYNIEALEIIAESACDLLAQVEFLPTLFGNFDCSTYELDLLQPLVELVSSCTSIVLTSGTERLGSLKELGVLIVQCFKQIIHSVVQRRVFADQYLSSNASNGVIETSLPNILQQQKVVSNLVAKERKRKMALRLSTKKFTEKPSLAFLFLQQNDLLPIPATPESIARYLRFTPNLPKDTVGSFLGELGKSDAKYEWETVEFHRQLLLRYVESFKLEGLSVLNCLRLFLSAFRLPGEAQQIDRILVAFSELCHISSCDSKSGVVENSEVTYLLTFSIIMLNTDRHNPNIRAERKMTMDQFVRNNKFYGKDVNQTLPIPQEYLEDIFRCIDKNQIRTEPNEDNAVLTEEEWMDIQMRIRANELENVMFTTNSSLLKLDLYGTDALANFTGNFLFADLNLYEVLKAIDGNYWVWDEDMLGTLEPFLLFPGICVHLYNRIVVQEVSKYEKSAASNESKDSTHTVFWKERTGRLMDLSGDFLMEFLNVCSKSNLQRTIDLVILLFSEIIGLKVPDLIEKLVECATNPWKPTDAKNAVAQNQNHSSGNLDSTPLFLSNLNFVSTQRSLLLLLEIILSFSHSIEHWEIVLYLLATLRDFSLLPGDFFVDKEEDLLPANLREDFDARMLEKDKETFATITLAELRDNISTPTSPSTFQLLGEALFGSSEKYNSPSSTHKNNIEGTIDNFLSSLDGYSSRWNENLLNARKSFPATKKLTEVFSYLNDSAIRSSIAKTNIANLISESKYLPEKQLLALLTAITRMVEHKMELSPKSDVLINLDYETTGTTCDNRLSDIYLSANKFYSSSIIIKCSITAASASWLETIFTEICLRNRDRFQLCWGIIKNHYLKTIGDEDCKVSYIAERQLNGVFKICGRMLSRDNYFGILIELLQRLFHLSNRATGKTSILDAKASISETEATSHHGNRTKNKTVEELMNQIAAGTWRILTQNIEVLPLLSLEQWETLFSIVAFGSSGTNFAAFKSFEILAWLLHEPRLIASVPVFCIFAIKPLIRNPNASESVSTGAIKLLMYLHSRLESIALNLITNRPTNSNATLVEEEMVDIWKKCWFPILQALAEGILDTRITTRNACVSSLCNAVRDKHIDAVPPSVMIDVVVHLLIPVIEITNGFHEANLPSNKEDQKIDENIKGETLETLNILFSKCLHKVRDYPSFDKVWFQVIDLLTTLSSVNNEQSSQFISEKAKGVLRAIIIEANEVQLFSRRKDLMLVTKNCLQGLPELVGIFK